MRFRLPDGCDGVTLGGVMLVKASDGTVDADAAAAVDLAPHGIVVAEDTVDGEPPAAPAKKP